MCYRTMLCIRRSNLENVSERVILKTFITGTYAKKTKYAKKAIRKNATVLSGFKVFLKS